MKLSRTEVDSSRRSAWAFTRLRQTGYPQYLRIRKRSELLTFLFTQYERQSKIYQQYLKNKCMKKFDLYG